MPFQKGQSGNPGGRRKQNGDLRDLARTHTENAVKTLAYIMENGETHAARVSAAEKLLDRAWGKPPQSHEHSGPDGDAIEARIKLSFE